VPARRSLPLSRWQLGAVVGMIVVGVGIRLWIGFTNRGVGYDIDTAYITARLLATHPLHPYSALRYPYPGGYFPVILACWKIAQATGVAFWAVFKVPAILADGGIAAAVAWGLGRLGAAPWQRLVSVALVALGPSFILISGYHGQIDSSAILPALLGVIVWRLGGNGRAWQAGLLVGLGAAIKDTPVVMVLAMLPTARSRREAAVLLGCSVGVPVASVLPFLIADTHNAWLSLTGNNGIPGWGGLSLLVQPSMIRFWFDPSAGVKESGLVHWMWSEENRIVAVAMLAAGVYVFRRRMDVIPAAALIWLVLYACSPDWAFEYFVWGLPFFLLAGRWVEVALLQLVLALPAAELYFYFEMPKLEWVYAPMMDVIWASFALAAIVVIMRTRAGRPVTSPAG